MDRNSNTVAGTADVEKDGGELDRVQSLPAFADSLPTTATRDIGNDTMTRESDYMFPDGGFEAWLQVVGGFLITANTWGLVNMWGTFQTYYSSQTPPLATGSAISWIGSIQSFLLLLVGALCGRPFDLGYSRSMMWSGAVIITAALLLTSLSGEFGQGNGNQVYYQVLLSQGIMAGLGMGLTLVPQVAIVASYFKRKRSLTIGIVTVGGSVGGVVYPIVFRRLVDKIGFHWSMRTLALIVFIGLMSSALILKQRKDIIDRSVKCDDEPQGFLARLLGALRFLKGITWGDWPYLVFVCSMFWLSMGLYCPFFYIERFTIDIGIDMHGLDTAYLVSFMNSGGAFGRIISGLLADFFGPITTQITFIILCTLTLFSWLSISTFSPLITFVVMYGFLAGAIIALPPTSVARLTSNMSVLGSRLGVMFFMFGLATLSGPPIAGALAGMGGKKGENAAKLYLGALMLLAGVFMWWARWLKVGFKLRTTI
ncbi:major facilitator superfamily domain-containing protein [Tirmania nivea]|nr:major facilitator superfamily domain-containing protein [Tirmania nivea]